MVRIGLVGIGFMGMIHYLASQHLSGATVTALCTRDRRKLQGDWTGIRGNFGPPGQQMDLSHLKLYEELEQLLADPQIDLIDICTPTHLHPSMVNAALKAGKHVLVEKAIALTPEDADEMVAVAKATGKLLMVAHVLPFFPEFAYAAQIVSSGTYGPLLGGHLVRVISKPDWSSEIGDASKTGGPAIDLHIHDTHFVGLLAGVPRAVFSSGTQEADGSVEYLTTNYLYGKGGPALSCSSGALAMSGRPFVHGFELYLAKATLTFSSAGGPLTLFTADGQLQHPKLEGGDPVVAFTQELQSAVDGVREGKAPQVLSGQLARDALVLCQRECESVRTGVVVEMG